jgi:hypothetical protein
VLAAFVAGRTSDQSLADFLNTQVFADSSLEQPNLTRRTPPVSTPSSSDTSARCPWNERLSSTADNTAGDLGLVEWCSRLLTEAPLIRCRGSTLLGPDRHPSDAL